jgi:hypothetical protein
MKYLPINKTPMHYNGKYIYHPGNMNDNKCEFIKISWFLLNRNNKVPFNNYIVPFMSIFHKYMQNDIKIDWYK